MNDVLYELVPEDLSVNDFRQYMDYRSYTSLTAEYNNVRMPSNQEGNSNWLSTYAVCDVMGLGTFVSEFDVWVTTRVPGEDPEADALIADSLVNQSIEAEFEDVTNFFLKRKDNLEILSDSQKGNTMRTLVQQIGQVPSNEADTMDTIKITELINIASQSVTEYFEIKEAVSEL